MTSQSEYQDNDASKSVNHKLVTIAAYNLVFPHLIGFSLAKQ